MPRNKPKVLWITVRIHFQLSQDSWSIGWTARKIFSPRLNIAVKQPNTMQRTENIIPNIFFFKLGNSESENFMNKMPSMNIKCHYWQDMEDNSNRDQNWKCQILSRYWYPFYLERWETKTTSILQRRHWFCRCPWRAVRGEGKLQTTKRSPGDELWTLLTLQ